MSVNTSPLAARKQAGRLQTPSFMGAMLVAASIYAILSWLILRAYDVTAIQFRLDLTPFLDSAMVLQVHVISALTAFGIGAVLLTGLPKGTQMHKRLGWAWVISMASTAISSFFLVGLENGHFSWIHGLSAWTMISLPFAVFAARQRKIVSHANHMRGMFLGGMMIAGLFSFLPGRMMWQIFFAI